MTTMRLSQWRLLVNVGRFTMYPLTDVEYEVSKYAQYVILLSRIPYLSKLAYRIPTYR